MRLMILGVAVLWLAGCTLRQDLGGGRYAIPMWQACDGRVVEEERPAPLYPKVAVRNCQPASGLIGHAPFLTTGDE